MTHADLQAGLEGGTRLSITGASKLAVKETTSASLFSDVKKEDPLAGKSKIWLALNPQPIARQTAAERRQQQEDRVDLGVLGTKNYSFMTAVGEAGDSLIQ
jgi:hypothetical protein